MARARVVPGALGDAPWKVAPPKAKTPPSEPTSQYPLPEGGVAPPTTGAWSSPDPSDPLNRRSPKVITPPSAATTPYTPPSVEASNPTAGLLSLRSAAEPWNRASPKRNTPPSAATIQYPSPDGLEVTPTAGLARGSPRTSPKVGWAAPVMSRPTTSPSGLRKKAVPEEPARPAARYVGTGGGPPPGFVGGV